MKSIFFVALLTGVLLVSPKHLSAQAGNAATPVDAQLLAKQELNQAAISYREDRFVDAQLHSEKALELDPNSPVAPYFVARTIHAQYKPGDTTEENLAKAREAIVAYQRIVMRSPNDEEAYKAIAYLYGVLKEDELQRAWIFRRASDPSLDQEKRAEAYIVLASKDWDCSFKITELPTNKHVTVKAKKTLIHYQMPVNQAEFDQARECSGRGLEMIDMAITLTPERGDAWSYRANILLELEKLAEMTGDFAKKASLHLEAEEAIQQTNKLSEKAKKEPAPKPGTNVRPSPFDKR